MIRQLPYGNIIAGLLIMISGLLVLVARSSLIVFAEELLLLFALWYLLPALMIQLLQGGTRPYLGWLGVLLILMYLLGYALIPPISSGGWDPFAGGSLFVLILVLLWLVSPAAAFVLVGISMIRSGYFPRIWGYAVALAALPMLLQGYAMRIPLALIFLLLGLSEILHKRPIATASS